MKPLGHRLGATIVITSLNRELLSLCRCFITPDVRVLVIDGQDGRRALRSIRHAIEQVEDDHVILLDEDAFIFNFWLLANGLRLDWLTGRTHSDGISTILHDATGEPLLIHTWYGRRFGRDAAQTNRIKHAALWASGSL